jgi:hypothetical protein
MTNAYLRCSQLYRWTWTSTSNHLDRISSTHGHPSLSRIPLALAITSIAVLKCHLPRISRNCTLLPQKSDRTLLIFIGAFYLSSSHWFSALTTLTTEQAMTANYALAREQPCSLYLPGFQPFQHCEYHFWGKLKVPYFWPYVMYL